MYVYTKKRRFWICPGVIRNKMILIPHKMKNIYKSKDKKNLLRSKTKNIYVQRWASYDHMHESTFLQSIV